MSSSATEPTPLRLSESLFENSMAQEAILLAWRAAPGAVVEQGQCLAEVMVEGMLHDIVAPASGRLVDVVPANTVLEPGDQLCRLAPAPIA
jgi:biotin carboxyl carrier protein